MFCTIFVGTNLNLPDGFCGSIISQGLEDAKGDKQWEVSGLFSRITLWNHDTAPSITDNTYRWKEWLEVSEKVCPESLCSCNHFLQAW